MADLVLVLDNSAQAGIYKLNVEDEPLCDGAYYYMLFARVLIKLEIRWLFDHPETPVEEWPIALRDALKVRKKIDVKRTPPSTLVPLHFPPRGD